VPADAIHGDWANLALEADGVLLGRARLQMFRPLSVRLAEPVAIHFGASSELVADPPIAAGTNIEVVLRNNAPAIQTFHIEASGDGLDILPLKSDLAIGATAERTLALRVFPKEGVTGLRDFRLHITGAATLDLPMRVLLLPRGRTVAWSDDLDGDGSPEWILESQRARAVFSTQDGGRWIEFTWKDGNTNPLPDPGLFAAPGRVHVEEKGDALEFSGSGWTRTVRLADAELRVEQSTPLPAYELPAVRRGNIALTVTKTSPSSAAFKLAPSN
jgi:hypothetical protein